MPSGVGVGLRLRRDDVAAAEIDAVVAELLRRDVDHPLDGVDRLGPPGAAIGIGRRRVGQRRARADVRRRHPIDRGEQFGALHQRHVHHAVRAGVADHRAAHREEPALLVQRQLQRDRLVAALIVAGEGLRAFAGPLHRAAEALGRPYHQRELRIEGVARAVVAADVAAFDPHVGRPRRGSWPAPASAAPRRRSRRAVCACWSPDRRRRPRRARRAARR